MLSCVGWQLQPRSAPLATVEWGSRRAMLYFLAAANCFNVRYGQMQAGRIVAQCWKPRFHQLHLPTPKLNFDISQSRQPQKRSQRMCSPEYMKAMGKLIDDGIPLAELCINPRNILWCYGLRFSEMFWRAHCSGPPWIWHLLHSTHFKCSDGDGPLCLPSPRSSLWTRWIPSTWAGAVNSCKECFSLDTVWLEWTHCLMSCNKKREREK